ncbi:2EXR domain [Fusarium oxysporum f. sp. vasinfectum]|nr:2EXR domain [Fusarium oxysporum f. sp. vasinfectum]
MPEDFVLFKQLPPELRTRIWRYALPPASPGVHFFRLLNASKSRVNRYGILLSNWPKDHYLMPPTWPVSPFPNTSNDSRKEMESHLGGNPSSLGEVGPRDAAYWLGVSRRLVLQQEDMPIHRHPELPVFMRLARRKGWQSRDNMDSELQHQTKTVGAFHKTANAKADMHVFKMDKYRLVEVDYKDWRRLSREEATWEEVSENPEEDATNTFLPFVNFLQGLISLLIGHRQALRPHPVRVGILACETY